MQELASAQAYGLAYSELTSKSLGTGFPFLSAILERSLAVSDTLPLESIQLGDSGNNLIGGIILCCWSSLISSLRYKM